MNRNILDVGSVMNVVTVLRYNEFVFKQKLKGIWEFFFEIKLLLLRIDKNDVHVLNIGKIIGVVVTSCHHRHGSLV